MTMNFKKTKKHGRKFKKMTPWVVTSNEISGTLVKKCGQYEIMENVKPEEKNTMNTKWKLISQSTMANETYIILGLEIKNTDNFFNYIDTPET